jgi:hypothetical protein
VGRIHGRLGPRARAHLVEAGLELHNRVGEWMQIDTGDIRNIAGVVTQGRRNSIQRVTAYKHQPGWPDVGRGRVRSRFQGQQGLPTRRKNAFSKKPVRQYVRILPQKWHAHMSMRAAVLVYEWPCLKGRLE